jgi:hypothetical protein
MTRDLLAMLGFLAFMFGVTIIVEISRGDEHDD